MAGKPKWDEFSEFDGAGVMPSTVFPKESDALTPADKLRLGYITGVEDDASSKPEPFQFVGGAAVEVSQEEADRIASADRIRQREIRSTGSDRYKNWPY